MSLPALTTAGKDCKREKRVPPAHKANRLQTIPNHTKPYLAVLLLSVLVLAVYGQTGNHAFINFDDQQYVYENLHVARGLNWEGIRWSFTDFYAGNWHPLTWLSHMTDVGLFGLDAGYHHLVSVLLHLVNVVLLFFLLFGMTGSPWRSAFVAAIFAVHPLHVESVAWISERKEVLGALFWLLTMRAYVGYVRKPRLGGCLSVVLFFAMGLLCKPMLVTLPFVLLLLDWWPLERYKEADSHLSFSFSKAYPLVREKIPLLVLSAISCVVTYLAQARGGTVSPLEHIPFGLRLSNALVSYAVYLVKTILPLGLAVFYPHPALIHAAIPLWKVAGSALLLGGISYLALRERERRPYLAVGWLWYLGTLVPVIGLVQVGEQAFADRYTYIPMIGILVAIAWGAREILPGWRFQKVALGFLGGAAVTVLSVAGWNQAGYWKDNLTLHSHTLRVTEKNWKAWNGLGYAYLDIGRYQQAMADFREALRIKPDYPEAWNNLGTVHGLLGQDEQGISYFLAALRLRPDFVDAWYNLGTAYGHLGRHLEASNCFRVALRFREDYVPAWVNLTIAYLSLGERGKAIETYQRLRRLDPAGAEELLRQVPAAR